MSVAELAITPFEDDESNQNAHGLDKAEGAISVDDVTDLLLRYEDLFDEVQEAFMLQSYSEESGIQYDYRAVFDYMHQDEVYQIQVHRLTVASSDTTADRLYGYVVGIFSPVEDIDEHHQRYTHQRLSFYATSNSVETTVDTRTIIEKDGVPQPDAYEARFFEAVNRYHDTHEHPDNPVDAEDFHAKLHRDLFRIAWDIAEDRAQFEEALGVQNTDPSHITPSTKQGLLTLAALIENFAAY